MATKLPIIYGSKSCSSIEARRRRMEHKKPNNQESNGQQRNNRSQQSTNRINRRNANKNKSNRNRKNRQNNRSNRSNGNWKNRRNNKSKKSNGNWNNKRSRIKGPRFDKSKHHVNRNHLNRPIQAHEREETKQIQKHQEKVQVQIQKQEASENNDSKLSYRKMPRKNDKLKIFRPKYRQDRYYYDCKEGKTKLGLEYETIRLGSFCVLLKLEPQYCGGAVTHMIFMIESIFKLGNSDTIKESWSLPDPKIINVMIGRELPAQEYQVYLNGIPIFGMVIKFEAKMCKNGEEQRFYVSRAS